jgi:SAM-dependent methyltransferase
MEEGDRFSNVAYYDALAERYHLFFRDFERSMEDEGRWLDNFLRPRKLRRVLDACCGTGRQSIPLVERGYEVVGADPSAAMLGQARRNAGRRGVELRLLRARFCELGARFGGEFDAVIALGNGLGNLQSTKEIGDALHSMRRCCNDHGVCIVGIKDFDRIRKERKRFHAHAGMDHNGLHLSLFQVWDFDDPILVVTAFALEDRAGSSDRRSIAVRQGQTREYMLCRAELASMARQAGLPYCRRLHHSAEVVYLLSAREVL